MSVDRSFTYVQQRWQEVTLQPGERREIIDIKEEGELLIVEFHAHNSKLSMEINLWGENGSLIAIMDFHNDFEHLLELGWGLAPGDVKPIAGISPDPAGKAHPVHPYLTRYKSTEEEDALGQTGKHYSMTYSPTVPIAYKKRIQIVVRNPTQSAENIHDVVVNRKVYSSGGQANG